MAASNPLRRALELAFLNQAQLIGLNPATQIRWPNHPWEPGAVIEYVRFTFSDDSRRAATLGSNPRIDARGHVVVQAFVRDGSGVDRIDNLLGVQGSAADGSAGTGMLGAYPITSELVYDQVSVRIEAAQPGAGVISLDGWCSSSWLVYWTQWRT